MIHVAVGNLNIDISLYVDRLPGPDEAIVSSDAAIGAGGAASNYAIAVTHYGHRAYLIATTSSYSFVDHVLIDLERHGVNVAYVKRVEGAPGIVSVIVDQRSGERIMVKYRGVNSLLSPNDVPRELLKNANIVHIASVEPSVAIEIARRASSLGILISYDPGSGAFEARNKVLEAIKYSNIVFLNRSEAKELVGSNLHKLLDIGADIAVIKRGPGGAYALLPGGMVYHGLSKPIRPVVDTTGAGDAFAAFFNAVYLESHDVGKALQYGVAAATLKISCRGSRLCYDRSLFNKQLNETVIEVLKNPPEWVLED